jgi:hypothetical protein
LVFIPAQMSHHISVNFSRYCHLQRLDEAGGSDAKMTQVGIGSSFSFVL